MWTKDHIYLARAGEETIIDFVPFSETELISDSEEVEKHTNKDMSVKGTPAYEIEKGMKSRNGDIDSEDVPDDRLVNGFASGLLVFDRSGRADTRVEKPQENKAVLQIHTIHYGFNSGYDFCVYHCPVIHRTFFIVSSGRAYYFRIPSRQFCHEIVENFKKRAEQAKREAQAKSKFVENQERARLIFISSPFQFFVACLIFAVSFSFLVSAI